MCSAALMGERQKQHGHSELLDAFSCFCRGSDSCMPYQRFSWWCVHEHCLAGKDTYMRNCQSDTTWPAYLEAPDSRQVHSKLVVHNSRWDLRGKGRAWPMNQYCCPKASSALPETSLALRFCTCRHACGGAWVTPIALSIESFSNTAGGHKAQTPQSGWLSPNTTKPECHIVVSHSQNPVFVFLMNHQFAGICLVSKLWQLSCSSSMEQLPPSISFLHIRILGTPAASFLQST